MKHNMCEEKRGHLETRACCTKAPNTRVFCVLAIHQKLALVVIFSVLIKGNSIDH